MTGDMWRDGPPDGTRVFEAVEATDIIEFDGLPTEYRCGIVFRDALDCVWVVLPCEFPNHEDKHRPFETWRFSGDIHFLTEQEAVAQTMRNLEEAAETIRSAIGGKKSPNG